MASKENDIDENENLKKRIARLEKENFRLKVEKSDLDDRMTEFLSYSDTAIVDFDATLKITHAQGNIGSIFGESMRRFEVGNNIANVIKRFCRNNLIKDKFKPIEESLHIDEAISEFISGQKYEKEFTVLGSREDGEMFLLVWKIKRMQDLFRSFFKIIPSNAIVKSSKEWFDAEISHQNHNLIEIMKKIPEGITLIDDRKKIMFMNEPAKITHLNTKIKDAPVEGRFYQEIFTTEDKDNIRIRMEKLEFAMKFKKAMRFVLPTQKFELQYLIYPILDFSGNFKNALVISSPVFSHEPEQLKEINYRLINSLKQIVIEVNDLRKILEEGKSSQILKKTDTEFPFENIFNEFGTTCEILNLFPIPICVLKIPGYRYEYANQEFCNKINSNLTDIKNQKDDNFFFGNDLISLETKNFDVVNKHKTVIINSEHISAKQFVLKDKNNKPAKIVRIYYKLDL